MKSFKPKKAEDDKLREEEEGIMRVALAKGREEKAIEVARNLFAEGLNIETIARITDLTVDTINALKKIN